MFLGHFFRTEHHIAVTIGSDRRVLTRSTIWRVDRLIWTIGWEVIYQKLDFKGYLGSWTQNYRDFFTSRAKFSALTPSGPKARVWLGLVQSWPLFYRRSKIVTRCMRLIILLVDKAFRAGWLSDKLYSRQSRDIFGRILQRLTFLRAGESHSGRLNQ